MTQCPSCGYDYPNGCDVTCEYKAPMAEWVNVKHKLPNKDEYVLLYDSSLDLIYGGKLLASDFYFFDRSEYSKVVGEDCEITHWMPLPNPPDGSVKDHSL